MIVYSDIDGTALDYDYLPDAVKVNRELIYWWRSCGIDKVALISNQGGLPFGVTYTKRKDGRPYPQPETCARRLATLAIALYECGIRIVDVRYCVFHPRANPLHVELAARKLRAAMIPRTVDRWTVYTTERARKPAPLMLNAARNYAARAFPDDLGGVYYGDSDEDEAAARAAGLAFVRVDRFV